MTAGVLRAAGLRLEPTGRNPRHFDVAFELGNIWSEAALPPELLDVLVTAYYGRPRPVQVARFGAAPQDKGGSGATVVELKL